MKTVALVVSTVLLAGLSSCAVRNLAPSAYITARTVDVTRLLAPPPADPLIQKRDVEAVRLAHDGGTSEQLERAGRSIAISVFQFADVLGPNFATDRLPITTRFFSAALRDLSPFLRATKDNWRRPRPFMVDPRIVPSERFLASTGDGPRFSSSYPSGHAAFGAMAAILLAEIVPERRAELFARGWEYGDARVVGGVHFPSDVEAGRILAASVVALMSSNERFRTDLAAARREVRAALGYR